jgi:hypothetical protein
MQCSLEVLAPTLSRVPLCIRPLGQPKTSQGNEGDIVETTEKHGKGEEEEEAWIDGLTNDFFEEASPAGDRPKQTSSLTDDEDETTTGPEEPSAERVAIWKAAQLYLGRAFSVSNVAHAIVPIRIDEHKKPAARGSDKNRPKLEVDLIVHGPDDDDEGDSFQEDEYCQDVQKNSERSAASMVLVRMVNRIPLLDSSEAAACGLVQSVTSKKRMWNSFGLDVTRRHDSSNVTKLLKLLTFEVRDSEQVAPFFQTRNHALLHDDGSDDDRESLNGEEEDSVFRDEYKAGVKRKRRLERRQLLPASVRLGNILVIVQIHAQPSNLPLPTLSKGRLPNDNLAIDNAMEVALTECLSRLQSTSSHLLLTASELRTAERDARYIPAISSSLSSILCKSTNPMESVIETVYGWQNTTHDTTWSTTSAGVLQASKNPKDVEALGKLIEDRLRKITTNSGKRKKSGKKTRQKQSMQLQNYGNIGMNAEDSDTDDLLSLSSPEETSNLDTFSQDSPHDAQHGDFEEW